MQVFNHVAVLIALIACATTGRAQLPSEVVWITQFGTSSEEIAGGIAVDLSGRGYVTGTTGGDLSGTGSFGGTDLFLTRVASTGQVMGSSQRGGPFGDSAYGVALGVEGGVWVPGTTRGKLDGSGDTQSNDAALLLFDSNGVHQITRAFGSVSADHLSSAVATADGVYAVGVMGTTMQDALITKFSLAGVQEWSRLVSTDMSDYASAITSDRSGNLIVTGTTAGNLLGASGGGSDAFVGKWDSEGNQIFLRTLDLGMNLESGHDVGIDLSGNIYIAGRTMDMHSRNETFLAKYASDGDLLWTRTYGVGGSLQEVGLSLVVTPDGGTWIGGYRAGPSVLVPGGTNAFLARFDPDGTLLYDLTLDTPGGDRIKDLAIGPGGDLWVLGTTSGSLGGENSGGQDIFVARVIPEPSATLLLGIGAATVAQFRGRRRWAK